MSNGDTLRWLADRLTPPENPTPEEQGRILRPGLPPTGPVERFGTWRDDGDKDRAAILREYAETWEHESETGAAEFWKDIADAISYRRRVARERALLRKTIGARPLPEIRASAATSRYWAQRLRWLRKRGRA